MNNKLSPSFACSEQNNDADDAVNSHLWDDWKNLKKRVPAPRMIFSKTIIRVPSIPFEFDPMNENLKY